jgi:hypothetical protein
LTAAFCFTLLLASRHWETGAACLHEHRQHARFSAVAAHTVAEQLLRFVELTGRNLTEGYILLLV